MEIIKHLHILGLITHDAVVSSLCFQLILVQPQSLSKKHYYLDSAQATTGLLKIIILILKQFLPILCHYSSSSASKGLQIDILASVIPPKCDSSWMYTGFWKKKNLLVWKFTKMWEFTKILLMQLKNIILMWYCLHLISIYPCSTSLNLILTSI